MQFLEWFLRKDYCFSKGLLHQQFQGTIILIVFRPGFTHVSTVVAWSFFSGAVVEEMKDSAMGPFVGQANIPNPMSTGKMVVCSQEIPTI